MYHTIEFVDEFLVDLEISPKHWLEQMLIRRGTRLQAQIKPCGVRTARTREVCYPAEQGLKQHGAGSAAAIPGGARCVIQQNKD
jgi:hypothetical protein